MENKEIFDTLKRIEQKIDSISPNPIEKEFYTVKEVCDILEISRSTFDRYKNKGAIRIFNVGKQIKIQNSDLKKIQLYGFEN